MNPSSSSSSLVPYSSSKRKRDPDSYYEHHHCKRPKYDVFVNYSFEDTGNHFVSHFKADLKRNDFTISDHKTLPIGQDESSELLKAIEDSHIYVVVISPKYPVSIKSLDELVLIKDSLSKFKDRRVFPVFLNVDPSDVKNQRGCFEEAFRTHEANVDPVRVYRWKEALKDAGHRSGQTLENGDEAELIQKVVQQLKNIQLPEKLSDVDHLVGIEPRAQALISELRLDDQDSSNIVAVLGISGSGKTTIVKAVFDRIVADFNFRCFIKDVHNRNKGPNWKFKLQREVIRRLTGNDPSYNVGEQQIRKFIANQKTLLVLDDVDNDEELEAFGITSAPLSSGSKIIVTTRNKQSLDNLRYTLYDISLLNTEESFKLFVGHAYGEDDLVDEKFVKEIVRHAGGLPLVLEVWGRLFKAYERTLWGRLLEKLKRIPHENIQMKLRMSYDSLGEGAKKLFLDIACFLYEAGYSPAILEGLEDRNTSYYPQIELKNLLDRGLVRIDDQVLELHKVIRKMGKEVVRQENAEPGKRTRLIGCRDLLHVLENNSGTDSVRGIMLNTFKLENQCIQVDALEKMNNLRFIHLYGGPNCSYSSSSEDMPISFIKHLKCLVWSCFPWRRINNDLGNVVVINLLSSKLEILWEGYKNLKKLMILDVGHSESLTRTGSFIGLENLEYLDISFCINLKEVDSSIVCLKKLKIMRFHYCKIIKSIPNLPEGIEEIHGNGCESLECLPSNMSDLLSLKKLSLNECVNLRPESLMKVATLRNLQDLSVSKCNISYVSREIGNLVSLRKLDLSKNMFSSLPDTFSNLSKLVYLNIDDCSELQCLPLLPLNLGHIKATGCLSLDEMPYELMRMAYIFRSKMFKVSNQESLFTRTLAIEISRKGIPDWCSTINKERGNVLSFEAPIMYPDKKIYGAILYTDYYLVQRQLRMLNKTKNASHLFDIFANNYAPTFIGFYPLNDETLVVEAGDTVELQFDRSVGSNIDIISFGLSLIYEGDLVDSALVIQNRNVTQLTDKVRSFFILNNGCVYYDFFS